MHFHTWGPFRFEKTLATESRWKAEFWQDQVSKQETSYGWPGGDIKSAIGCYMFATKTRTKYTPWYVGKTTAKLGFQSEIFQPHKLDHYASALEVSKQTHGFIFLFPLIAKNGKLSHAKSSYFTIAWLEKTLIGMALSKNPALLNLRDTLRHRNVWVEGVFGKQSQGRSSYPATEARKALF